MTGLVLSLFPGIGMLDHAFDLEGFTVVRGPDVIWGGDIRAFNPPAGVFDGVIGGPPCQAFSPIGNVNRARWGEDSVMPDLVPEFARVVNQCRPGWYLMENSPRCHGPKIECGSRLVELNSKWLGERQSRHRRFWSNLRIAKYLDTGPALLPVDAGSERAVSSKGSVDWKGSRSREPRRSVSDMLDLQGFPRDWMDGSPLTIAGQKRAVGNGVPLPMGRAIARAVIRSLESEQGAA